MKGAIIINAFSGIGEHQAQRLKEEFFKKGVEVPIIKNNVGAIPCDLDFCIFLDKDIYTAKALENRGVRLFNRSDAIAVCDDKMLTYLALENKVAEPLTVAGAFSYTAIPANDDEVDSIVRKLGLPLILKLSKNSLGEGVYLVKTKSELKEYITRFRCIPHIYQKFIEASVGKDIRIIVVGSSVVASMMRVNENDYRSNIELGGVGMPFEADENLKELAVRVSNLLNLDYCGIDFLIDGKDDYLVCEVNSNAFFKGIESVSHVNVAALYVEYVLQNI